MAAREQFDAIIIGAGVGYVNDPQLTAQVL